MFVVFPHFVKMHGKYVFSLFCESLWKTSHSPYFGKNPKNIRIFLLCENPEQILYFPSFAKIQAYIFVFSILLRFSQSTENIYFEFSQSHKTNRNMLQIFESMWKFENLSKNYGGIRNTFKQLWAINEITNGITFFTISRYVHAQLCSRTRARTDTQLWEWTEEVGMAATPIGESARWARQVGIPYASTNFFKIQLILYNPHKDSFRGRWDVGRLTHG